MWQRFGTLPRPLQLISAFLGVSLLVSAIGIAQKIFGVTAEGIWVDPAQFPDLKVRVFSTLVNPNILAGYLVLVVAYSTAFFNQTKAYKKMASDVSYYRTFGSSLPALYIFTRQLGSLRCDAAGVLRAVLP